jgi:hypothetical protein
MGDRANVERTACRSALALFTAVYVAGCVTEVPRQPRSRPLLLSDYEAIIVPRDQISRYRCSSGGILQCNGPSDHSATCVCAPLVLWPVP